MKNDNNEIKWTHDNFLLINIFLITFYLWTHYELKDLTRCDTSLFGLFKVK